MPFEVGAVRPSSVFVESKPSSLQTEAATAPPKEAAVSKPLTLSERADKAILGDVAEVVTGTLADDQKTPLLIEAKLALTANPDTPEGRQLKLNQLEAILEKTQDSPADDKTREIQTLVNEIKEGLKGINPLMETLKSQCQLLGVDIGEETDPAQIMEKMFAAIEEERIAILAGKANPEMTEKWEKTKENMTRLWGKEAAEKMLNGKFFEPETTLKEMQNMIGKATGRPSEATTDDAAGPANEMVKQIKEWLGYLQKKEQSEEDRRRAMANYKEPLLKKIGGKALSTFLILNVIQSMMMSLLTEK